MKCSLFAFLCFVAYTNAALTISNALGSNMVLQRAPLQAHLWGTTEAATTVAVDFNGQTINAQVDGVGNWNAWLPATVQGGPYVITVAASTGEKIAMQNILFGDVYICSGQSNMQFTVDSAFNSSYEVQRANNYPDIRIFSVGTSTYSGTPLGSLAHYDLGWSVASSATVGGGNWTYMSAVCWFSGANLYDYMHVPIGLISTNWGGTIIQAWSSPEALNQCNVTTPAYNATGGPNQNSVLYNAMIVPFLPMAIRGALWYQGESNVGQGALYGCMEVAMINDWRAKFGIGFKFPFFFVQLAPWIGSVSSSTAVADIRSAQLMGLALPVVGYASAVDLGDPTSPFNNIHPRNKQEVGRRLSSAILNIAYDQTSIVWQGPVFASASHSVSNDVGTISVVFNTFGKMGLMYMPATCPPQVPSNTCVNWEAMLSDGSWYPATAPTSNSASNTLTLTFPVPSGFTIKGVRYAYSIWPLTTLFSEEGLPAIPFSYMFTQ